MLELVVQADGEFGQDAGVVATAHNSSALPASLGDAEWRSRFPSDMLTSNEFPGASDEAAPPDIDPSVGNPLLEAAIGLRDLAN